MAKIIKIIWRQTIKSTVGFLKDNLRNISYMLIVMLPFTMYFIGKYYPNDYLFLLIPIFILLLCYWLIKISDEIGKGYKIPTPNKRFTTIDEYGEVSIENDRLQELILYIGDLEDWFKRRGITDN